MLLEQCTQECGPPSTIFCMIWSGGDGLESNEFLKRFDKLIFMYLGFSELCVSTTASYIPDRNGIVIRSCDIELLVLERGNCRCQNSSLVSFPSVDTVVFLAEA